MLEISKLARGLQTEPTAEIMFEMKYLDIDIVEPVNRVFR